MVLETPIRGQCLVAPKLSSEICNDLENYIKWRHNQG